MVVVLREGQTFQDLYNERVRLFERYADVTICEDGCQIEETIEKVLEEIEKIGVKSDRRNKNCEKDFTFL